MLVQLHASHSYPSAQVNVAGKWQAARQEEIKRQQAVILEYDWTFTTPYTGILCHTSATAAGQPQQEHVTTSFTTAAGSHATGLGQPSAGSSNAQAESASTAGDAGQMRDAYAVHCSHQQQHQQQPCNTAVDSHQPHEAGTSSTHQHSHQLPSTAQASLQQLDGAATFKEPASRATDNSGVLPEWQSTTTQIDRALLMQRDDPILFYADVPLYESELDDNGVCQLAAKVRVMPKCWLVLLRFFLRVDGCLVRLRETRLFCR